MKLNIKNVLITVNYCNITNRIFTYAYGSLLLSYKNIVSLFTNW